MVFEGGGGVEWVVGVTGWEGVEGGKSVAMATAAAAAAAVVAVAAPPSLVLLLLFFILFHF